MRDRDAVVTYETLEPSSKKLTLTWKRSDEPGDPQTGIRIDRVEGRTEIEPAPEGTHLSYTYFADLGGDFGSSVEEKAFKHEPLKYFEAVRASVGKGRILSA